MKDGHRGGRRRMRWWTSRRIWAWKWMSSLRPQGVTRGSPTGHCSGGSPFHAAASDSFMMGTAER
eukprot:4752145-Pyramimonas_sp.AAC.1